MKKSTVPCAAVPLLSSEMSCFFGFHDLYQFDVTERYVLALEVGFQDRPAGPSDAAGIIVGDLQTGTNSRVDETTAWNFPQGARQQWWPSRDDVHVYTFLNERLAKFYDIPGVTGPEFRKVDLPARNHLMPSVAAY